MTACATTPPAEPLVVTGTATYLERIALPQQAVFEAGVEDVSRADAASVRLGEVRIESPRAPVSFSIPVDRNRVSPNGRYVVRATIRLDGRLLYTTDTAQAVLGPSDRRHVDLVLRRVAVAPAPATSRMNGHYTYMADAGVFTDCANGQRLPVLQEADNAALERAYLAARGQPGMAMLVTVDGRIVTRPRVEGSGPAQAALHVERFIAIRAGPCGTPHSSAKLEDTYWKLVSVRGRAVASGERQREPHFVMHAAGSRVSGFGGCNRLVGSYTLEGERLSFSRMAGTMMACPQGAQTEGAFIEALGASTRWRIDAEQLELFDAQGATTARFESRYMR
jgi:uncharacterized lipoprotein YbaY/heat shock protein HslJ